MRNALGNSGVNLCQKSEADALDRILISKGPVWLLVIPYSIHKIGVSWTGTNVGWSKALMHESNSSYQYD